MRLIPFIIFSFLITSCSSPRELTGEDERVVCLNSFFKWNEMSNCLSFASSEEILRQLKIIEKGDSLFVSIQIPDCESEFELHYNWLATELQNSCFKEKKVKYQFTDGSDKIHFSVFSNELSILIDSGEKTVYVDKEIDNKNVEILKTILDNPDFESESSFSFQLVNNKIEASLIQYFPRSNNEGFDYDENARNDMKFFRLDIEKLGLTKEFTVHIMDQFGVIKYSQDEP